MELYVTKMCEKGLLKLPLSVPPIRSVWDRVSCRAGHFLRPAGWMGGVVGGMRGTIAISALLAVIALAPAAADDCPTNPAALGTSRTIVVDPTEHPLLGSHNYRESLPLNDREVVLTFDDGPLPPYTTKVLDDLAAECVKATFFLVGRMARNFPHVVQRIYDDGHTVGNHSQNHPFTFNRMSVDRAAIEIEDGFASIRAALGEGRTVAPFFRIPGLLRQESVENYLTSRGVMTWSVDARADDWHRRISDREIVNRAIARLEERGKGILLLHDIKIATSRALPNLLAELKAHGFRIVHVVPAGPGRPKTVTSAAQWIARHGAPTPGIWPRVQVASVVTMPLLDAPSPDSFGIVEPVGPLAPIAILPSLDRPQAMDIARPAAALWPSRVDLTSIPRTDLLPAPGADNFRYSRVWRQRSAKADFRRPGLLKGQDPAAAKKDGSTTGKKDIVLPKVAAPTPLPPRAAPKELPSDAVRPPRPIGHQLAPPPAPRPAAQTAPPGLMDRIGSIFR
jgi:peptidoglycan-N-acetylglucosamine deacetylase